MHKMSVFFWCCLITLLFSYQGSIAQQYLDSARLNLFEENQNLIYNDQFSEADSVSTQWIINHPTDPTGYILRA